MQKVSKYSRGTLSITLAAFPDTGLLDIESIDWLTRIVRYNVLMLTFFGTGAWTIHPLCICLLKLLFNSVPGANQELSWTLVNITYACASFLMFHWVRGVPFDFNAGAYDNLNMWEQIDNGDQYTPAKKFLLVVPIGLFLLSTHFTHYDLTYFIINFLAVLLVVIPKLPVVSRRSVFLILKILY